jgi:hypothetical protein
MDEVRRAERRLFLRPEPAEDKPRHRMVDAGEPLARHHMLENPLHRKPRPPALSDHLQPRITQAGRIVVGRVGAGGRSVAAFAAARCRRAVARSSTNSWTIRRLDRRDDCGGDSSGACVFPRA